MPKMRDTENAYVLSESFFLKKYYQKVVIKLSNNTLICDVYIKICLPKRYGSYVAKPDS